ncbi:MAG: hypothetical protein Q7T01_02505 [bacterium]|nr:hypothetical protein [bacterium]
MRRVGAGNSVGREVAAAAMLLTKALRGRAFLACCLSAAADVYAR